MGSEDKRNVGKHNIERNLAQTSSKERNGSVSFGEALDIGGEIVLLGDKQLRQMMCTRRKQMEPESTRSEGQFALLVRLY